MPRVRPLSALVGLALLTSLAVAAPAAGANEKRSYIVVLKQDVAAPTVAAKHARKFGTSLKSRRRFQVVSPSGPKKSRRMLLSTPTTDQPRASKWRAHAEPIRPLLPVTRATGIPRDFR